MLWLWSGCLEASIVPAYMHGNKVGPRPQPGKFGTICLFVGHAGAAAVATAEMKDAIIKDVICYFIF